jgi:hypothetical protein
MLMVRLWTSVRPNAHSTKRPDATREAARDEVDQFLALYDTEHAAKLFEHVALLWIEPSQKLEWLREYCERKKADRTRELRTRRTTRWGELAAEIVALVRSDLNHCWTSIELAWKFGVTAHSMGVVTREMRIRHKLGLQPQLVMIDEGRGLLTVPTPGLQIIKSASHRIIELLIQRPMTFSALQDAIGSSIGFQVANMRKNGVLKPPATPHSSYWTKPDDGGPAVRGGTPLELSADARTMIALSLPITTHSGRVLWVPPDLDF